MFQLRSVHDVRRYRAYLKALSELETAGQNYVLSISEAETENDSIYSYLLSKIAGCDLKDRVSVFKLPPRSSRSSRSIIIHDMMGNRREMDLSTREDLDLLISEIVSD